MRVTSSSFVYDAEIPLRHSCEGDNISPHLSWRDIPTNTRSFVLVFDDADAPMGPFVHWVLYDIPASVTDLQEGISSDAVTDFGARQGMNGYGRMGYDGPCPVNGIFHTFRFTIFALSGPLGLPPGERMSNINSAMMGKVVDSQSLQGRYRKVGLRRFFRSLIYR